MEVNKSKFSLFHRQFAEYINNIIRLKNMKSIESDENISLEKLKTEKPKERIVWLDIARGFVIVYMIITLIFDHSWFADSMLLQFLFVHPARVPGAHGMVVLQDGYRIRSGRLVAPVPLIQRGDHCLAVGIVDWSPTAPQQMVGQPRGRKGR